MAITPVRLGTAAPKGAIDGAAAAARLKARPDTNLYPLSRASITLSALVGRIRVISNPALANSVCHSPSVRSRPPDMSSISRRGLSWCDPTRARVPVRSFRALRANCSRLTHGHGAAKNTCGAGCLSQPRRDRLLVSDQRFFPPIGSESEAFSPRGSPWPLALSFISAILKPG